MHQSCGARILQDARLPSSARTVAALQLLPLVGIDAVILCASSFRALGALDACLFGINVLGKLEVSGPGCVVFLLRRGLACFDLLLLRGLQSP